MRWRTWTSILIPDFLRVAALTAGPSRRTPPDQLPLRTPAGPPVRADRRGPWAPPYARADGKFVPQAPASRGALRRRQPARIPRESACRGRRVVDRPESERAIRGPLAQ